MERSDSIMVVKGIGEKTAKLFSKKKIANIDDLLKYYPKAYQEFKDPVCIGEVLLEERVAVLGQICQKPITRNLAKINITVTFFDFDSSKIRSIKHFKCSLNNIINKVFNSKT